MAYLVALLMVLASLLLVSLPFVRRRARTSAADPLEELRRRRLALYEEMRSLRLDYELGRLSGQEYVEKTGECRRRAALLLRQEEILSRAMEELARRAEKAVEAVSGAEAKE